MPIKLNGATSGSVELDVPAAVGSDLQLTFPATAGTALVAPGSTSITVPSVNGTLDRLERAGNILQVVQNYITGTSSVVAAGQTDIPGFSQSITPTSSSSKILVRVRWSGEWSDVANYDFVFRLKRNGTVVGNAASHGIRTLGISGIAQGYYTGNADSTQDSTWFEYLDSPNSTSSVIYQVCFRSNNSGTFHTNRTFSNVNSSAFELLTSSITLIEVAA